MCRKEERLESAWTTLVLVVVTVFIVLVVFAVFTLHLPAVFVAVVVDEVSTFF